MAYYFGREIALKIRSNRMVQGCTGRSRGRRGRCPHHDGTFARENCFAFGAKVNSDLKIWSPWESSADLDLKAAYGAVLKSLFFFFALNVLFDLEFTRLVYSVAKDLSLGR